MASNLGPSDELWDINKDIIIDLYLRPKATLSDVILTMSTDYGKPQYETRFKKWKIRKNLSKTEWHSLSTILGKRKDEGKSSEVYLNSQIIPTKKIRREELRYGLKYSDEDMDGGTYRIPDGIQIRTPVQTPISINIEDASNLLDTGTNQDNIGQTTNLDSEAPIESHVCSGDAFRDLLFSTSHASPSNTSHYDHVTGRCFGPVHVTSAAKTAGKCPEIADSLQQLVTFSSSSSPEEIMSRNLDLDPTLKAVTVNRTTITTTKHCIVEKSRLLESELQAYMQCRSALLPIRGIGFNFLNILRFSVFNNAAGLGNEFVSRGLERVPLNTLLHFPRSSLVTEWLLEVLIRQAIESGDLTMISQLNSLSGSSLDPNKFVCVSSGGWYTPLERASMLFHVELVQALVDAKANPNKSYSKTGPLDYVMQSIYRPVTHRTYENNVSRKNLKSARKIVRLLLDAGASLTPNIRGRALSFGDAQILSVIELAGGWKSFTQENAAAYHTLDLRGANALVVYADILCKSADQDWIIDHLASMVQKYPLERLEESADAHKTLQALLSSAIQYERNNLIGKCIELGAKFRSIDLVLALSKGDIQLSRSIIGSGVDVNVCFGTGLQRFDGLYYTHPHLFDRSSQLLYLEKQTGQTRKLCLTKNSNSYGHHSTTAFSGALRLGYTGRKICEELERKGNLFSSMPDVYVFEAISTAATESGDLVTLDRLLNMFRATEYTLSNADTYIRVFTQCLELAIKNGQSEIQWYLLSLGFGTDSCGRIHIIVLKAALRKRNFAAYNYLMSYGHLKGYLDEGLLREIILYGDYSMIKNLASRFQRIEWGSRGFTWKEVFLCHSEDYKLVELLISLGAPVNGTLPTKALRGLEPSALETAVKIANLGMVKHLLGLEILSYDPIALIYALFLCKESVPLILEAFARRHPKGQPNYGSQALKYAIATQDMSLIRDISYVADVNGNENYYLDCPDSVEQETWDKINRQLSCLNPLGTAISVNREEKISIIRILLDKGADPNLIFGSDPKWDLQETALTAAIRTKDLEVIRLLETHGASINCSMNSRPDLTPLQYAARLGHTDVVEWLLRKGADVNAEATVSSGGTALQLASEYGSTSIVRTLLEFGADVNANPPRFHGGSALQLASYKGHIEIVNILLQAGAAVNAPGSEFYGKTALQFAAENGWVGIAETLLSNGANINADSNKFCVRTALQLAAENGRFAMVGLLIKQGAKLEPGQILKAIHLAEQKQYVSIVKYLTKIYEKRQPH